MGEPRSRKRDVLIVGQLTFGTNNPIFHERRRRGIVEKQKLTGVFIDFRVC
jgi:hypothetical protein